MKLVIISSALALLVSCGPTKKCGENEEFLECGTDCEPVCGKPFPKFCNEKCLVDVCQCKRGYKRGPKGCVLDKDCPKPVECEDKNAERRESGEDPKCQLTCEDIKKGLKYKACNEMLYFNQCYCKEGFVPIKEGGKCTEKEKCPK